ncbi:MULTISPECIES: metal ABC transporter ATP-binding protein [Microbacterium]|uniref:metal ABC transporter ATP-binding protein n=1 Tax=Microbacterium TaxID=33882 RepID=UPI00046828BA|nr:MULTISPECIES: ATP-binding cassette domain-containing protein [Microbacterium]AMG82586.1 ABC transporter ATP-binding protein [Microbacterium sp. PAMC 28756]QXE29438.1 ATP-binding cassette domain-containing protein [Microbacterium paraoxydans]
MTRTLRAADGALRLDGVSVRLGDHEALRGVTLEVEAGEFVVVTGPNGAGKSTLLEVAAGVRSPTRGRRSATGPIAFVPQRAAVPPGLPLTARDVVTVGTWRRLGAFRRRDRRARAAVAAAMERTAVSALQRLPFATLSGGQQQRVLLAHGLAGEASVLLVDEPTTALDAASVRRIRAVLREEADRGAVVLCVTHDATLIADADREVALRDGMRLSASR